ncbi:MAG: translocation/assembly module TamB domain-containing protein [Nitrospiraceae bacterium]|nr:MAG: translocation/assembly module TamB domain-containing protein [Nitrospiraceae bacterium]
MLESIKKRSTIWKFLGITLLIYGLVFFLFRGPYLSNYIKRIFVPFLENVTRERIIIDRAAINLFPFYLQAKGFKLFDRDGNRLLRVSRARVYIDLLGLLSKEIRIRRFFLQKPLVTANENDIRRIAENINVSLAGKKEKQYNVILKGIKLVEGQIEYSDAEEKSSISAQGLFVDMIPKWRSSRIELELNEVTARLPAGSVLQGEVSAKMKLTEDNIEIDRISINTPKSSLKFNGNVQKTRDWQFSGGGLSGIADIDVDEINNALGLKVDRNGLLNFDGTVELVANNASIWPDLNFKLNTDIWFYLETLMEIIHVDKEIFGKVSAKGVIEGIYPDLSARGKASLFNSVIEGFPLDEVKGDVAYKNNKFSLNDFLAKSYGGDLRGKAYILLPHGDYRVTGTASGVSSPDFLKFIRWEPPFPKGVIGGAFQLDHEHGKWIDVIADIGYGNTSERTGNVLDRLISIETGLVMKDRVIKLRDTVFKTAGSELFMNGKVDLNNHKLDLDLELQSRDISDITAPYYERFIAPASFRGKADGPTDDVEIRGTLEAHSGGIHGVPFRNGSTDFTYRTKSLAVSRLTVLDGEASYDASGSIDFRQADELFSFKDPYYRGKASVNNIPLNPIIKASYRDIPVNGFVSGALEFDGDAVTYNGEADLKIFRCDLYGQILDQLSVRTLLFPDGLQFPSINATKGSAKMSAEGSLRFDAQYHLSARLDNTRVSDIHLFDWAPFELLFTADIEGTGTLDEPDLSFEMDVGETTYKKIQAGDGSITGKLKGRDVQLHGVFGGGTIKAESEVKLSDIPFWSLDMDFNKGRYDFILEDLIDEPPADSSLSLEGQINMVGRGLDYLVQSEIRSLDLTAYGYALRNRDSIIWEYMDEKLEFIALSLTGNEADLDVSGSVTMDRSYNLSLNGDMDISPLAMLSDQVELLRGKADFDIDIEGFWDTPELLGVINIEDVALNYEDFPYVLGPVNGSLFLNKDRVVFNSITSSFAGGTVYLSGTGFFKDLDLERLYISADMIAVKVRPVEGVRAAFDGTLFLSMSPKGSSITGNIDIDRAKYERRVDWSSWLPGLQQSRGLNLGFPESLSDASLNISIKGTEDIVIQNNLARSPVRMSVNVIGTVSKPGIIGRFEADEGTIYFRGNEFRILEGSSIDFVDSAGMVPLYHILADTYRNNYYIRLSLDGTTDKLSLSLFSDPPLPEDDILSLLTFGQLGREARGLESGIAASEATALVTGGIQKEVQYITGFERFEIEPHTTTEGAFSPKVTLGKRMLEDRIFVIYSRAIGTAEEQVVKVEYKLERNLFLVGSRDEVGGTGLDLKYKFDFK